MPNPIERVRRTVWKGDSFTVAERPIPNEVAIAITYGGSTQAVMMATPADFEDFAVGFSTTEGLIRTPKDITSLEVIEEAEGVELRMWLVPELAETYSRRRRLLAGPTGCGLCGIESLTEAVKAPAAVSAAGHLRPQDIVAAMAALPARQVLNEEARAIHAAGFWTPGEGLVAVREDVGRHNALDKLVGHLVRSERSAKDGLIVLTSRVSVEMVQKAAAIGAPVIAAVSAPTALAVKMAEEAGITLIAIARGDSFEVFTHAGRIGSGAASSAA
ncbi:sulfurtransferase FdhD [Terrihabitans soli]|uniref:Sulfur carrier protein FdhD n=1 Tax=Terrihabitans soli TaxID=708113 RepID=A0A6S6QG30_9HYPH|nr:formate dehydrogenase accessory sulfurtransferase FdhD [Terrihabitans soli]BCJ90063.1 sulfurtransferase FdhD [Terrihabitans soli]